MRRESRATRARTAAVLVLLLAIGCGDSEDNGPAAAGGQPQAPIVPVPEAQASRDVAVLRIEGHGEIRIELLPELAPRHVESFVKLAETDVYDGTVFHRVVPGFMIQGGDPLSKDDDPRNDGQGGPGYTLPAEFSDVSFLRGVVGMARKAGPDSAGSQFFIVQEDSRQLDGQYTVFGRVVEGLDVVDAISRVPIDTYGRHGPRDRPRDDVVLGDVRIERPPASREAGDKPPAAPPARDDEWDEGSS